MLPRLAADYLRRAARVSPVVVLMGARQTGKSTLVQTLPDLISRPYVTLDDITVLEQARTAPDDLVRRAPMLTIDEVQREPDLVLAIKRAVDEQRPRVAGRFILTGSANLLLMRRVSETLAGRATYVNLWPLTRREQLALGGSGRWDDLIQTRVAEWPSLLEAGDAPPADWRALARTGGFPTPAYELAANGADRQEERRIWFAGYVQTYLERDLQDLSAIENLVDFRRLMRATCLRLGNLLNQTELARDTGIAQTTVQRYLNLLETSFQFVRLQAYAVNRTKRLIKAPKLCWGDTGLAMFLADETTPRGAHLENLVLTDLIAWRDAQVQSPQVLYWRTAKGQEVDFVIEYGERLLAIEVKSSARPVPADAGTLRAFVEEYGDAVHGALLLHDGRETFRLGDRIVAAPWWQVV
ncbi:MAG: ATP-binding protein [Gemmatimonadota bacterium]|nr:ATP-binding protein [Gemmatimonadota bacterium]